MSYDILVEVSRELSPGLRDRLLSAAYRASRSSRVALVLDGVDRADVDRALDPVVRRVGVGVTGVTYLSPEEARSRMVGNGARPCLVVSPDPDWLLGVSAPEARVEGPEDGLRSMQGA